MQEQSKAGSAGRPGRGCLRDGQRRSGLCRSRRGVLPGKWGELRCPGGEQGSAPELLPGNLARVKIGELCRAAVATAASVYFGAAVNVPPGGVLGAAAGAACSLEPCRRGR